MSREVRGRWRWINQRTSPQKVYQLLTRFNPFEMLGLCAWENEMLQDYARKYSRNSVMMSHSGCRGQGVLGVFSERNLFRRKTSSSLIPPSSKLCSPITLSYDTSLIYFLQHRAIHGYSFICMSYCLIVMGMQIIAREALNTWIYIITKYSLQQTFANFSGTKIENCTINNPIHTT